jgi:hypothetical protein
VSNATLTATDQAGARVVTIDCPHGETSVAYINATNPDALKVTDTAAAVMALARHFDEERCGCTAELRRRYGVDVG